jgi:hypothetical protein
MNGKRHCAVAAAKVACARGERGGALGWAVAQVETTTAVEAEVFGVFGEYMVI